MSGGKSRGSETVTQVQQVPPEIRQALNFLTGSSMGLASRYGFGSNGANYSTPSRPDLGSQPGGVIPFGSEIPTSYGSTPPPSPTFGSWGDPVPTTTPAVSEMGGRISGSPMARMDSRAFELNPLMYSRTNTPVNGATVTVPNGGKAALGGPINQPASLVPDLNSDTLSALGMLRGAYTDNPAVGELQAIAAGDYSNPATGMNPEVLRASVGTNTVDTMNPNADMRSPVLSNTVSLNNDSAGMVNTSAAGVNDFAKQPTDLSGVTDQITNAARLAVGDRFAAAGRSGSGNEGLELGRTVARELAPYAFNAREADANRRFSAGESSLARRTAADESRINRMTGADESRIGRSFTGRENYIDRNLASSEARNSRLFDAGGESTRMNYNAAENAIDRNYGAGESYADRMFSAGESALSRGFAGYEADRARQLAALGPLLNLPMQQAQNYLNVGQILEEQDRRQALEPFELLGLLTDPLVAAISGAPRSTTTTGRQRNVGLGFSGLLGVGN